MLVFWLGNPAVSERLRWSIMVLGSLQSRMAMIAQKLRSH